MIRSYRASDLESIYDICVRTGAAGQDARGLYSSDRLLGDIWAVPYVVHEPQHAHVVDDGEGNVVGYVLGTADTPAFVEWYRTEWLPATADRMPAGDPRDEVMLGLHHDPERMLLPELAGYPAHLHIDLLPEAQGKGLGRGLMAAFLAGLRAAGVPRVHLGMAPENHGAYAFYQRLGFHDIPTQDTGALFLGRDTAM
ncbi:putative GCN5-related N-acetyltransferase [Actinoplanes missouriensis 431]|uniref:Putative GCN5-related N-acetyltransferase n=1 Tax=Actinoplanes missouriensis (strain ATCC 14538 / DSM 43046 / CBS 188.64 / JCM 3121 / NBRC 102363 / NCIMB 12654 / NRRL B-3342 / UNCC 431) TaxID=512565 RepID=I0H1E8_ACTM4|nr:GNAT family N-acetyltransferase [Actinoplanes missouriensis]BAL86835.1 putative GCN5-related N-acetyltransferase [Actinoplanes missouriensis 431]